MNVEIETDDQHESTPSEYKDTKLIFFFKYIHLKVIKVHQKKKKIKSYSVMNVNINVLKRYTGTIPKKLI